MEINIAQITRKGEQKKEKENERKGNRRKKKKKKRKRGKKQIGCGGIKNEKTHFFPNHQLSLGSNFPPFVSTWRHHSGRVVNPETSRPYDRRRRRFRFGRRRSGLGRAGRDSSEENEEPSFWSRLLHRLEVLLAFLLFFLIPSFRC